MAEALVRLLGGASAALIFLLSGGAGADEGAQVGNAVGTESAPIAGGSLVIIADPARTETENAHLRATLNAVARDHGFDPTKQVDVNAVATRESLMSAGTVTADPDVLERLRGALGVAALVRVSEVHDREGGTVRITVVAAGRTQTRLLPSYADDVVAHAMDVLLPRQNGTPPAPRSSLQLDENTPADEPSTAQLWAARTGFRPAYGAMAFASVTALRHFAFSAAGPNGTGTLNGTATAIGVGGGIGARIGAVYLPTLTPSKESPPFFSFRTGIGLDTDFLYLRVPKTYAYSGATKSVVYGNRALWVASLPIQVGGAVAIGRFTGDTHWSGALLGLAYAPQVEFAMDLRGSSGNFRFNPAGAELSVDVTALDASRGNESSPQIRIAVWGVAPLDDAHPGLLSLGLGAIWY
jgi:hypothetical protein